MLELQNDLYLATLLQQGESKWRPQTIRDCFYFSILTTYKLHISASIADSNAIVTASPIFGVPRLNGTIVHCAWCKGVQKFKIAAYNIYTSACRRNKNAISRANTQLVEEIQLNGAMFHCTGHKGSPEIQDCGLQTGSTYISACRLIETRFQVLTPNFWGTATQWHNVQLYWT